MALDLNAIGNALQSAAQTIGTYSANAASRANSISQQAQSAQGAFNQESANQANMLNDMSIANQYGFNSAMMQSANQFNTEAWEQAAAWNEKMWKKQAKFNAEQAEIQRAWQEKMANTQYQRAIADMGAAGLNPILAATGGGIGTGIPGGAQASVGGAQMGSASAEMASGGLLGANTASESNYTGQMEQMSSTLALIGAFYAALSSGASQFGQLGEIKDQVEQEVQDFTDYGKNVIDKGFIGETVDELKEVYNMVKENGGIWPTLKKAFGKNDNNHIKTKQDEAQYLRYNAWNKSTYKYTKPKG